MFCIKCGYEIDSEFEYCPKCGAKTYKIEDDPDEVKSSTDLSDNTPVKPVRTKPVRTKPSRTTKPNGKIAPVIVAFAILVAVIVILIAVIGRKKEFDIAPFVSIETLGFEGQGVATCIIDEQAIIAKLQEELELDEESAREIASKITVSPEQYDGLESAQIIDFSLGFDSELAKHYKVEPTYSGSKLTKGLANFDYVVEELQQGILIDISGILQFTTEGNDGIATAKLKIDSGDLGLEVMKALGTDINLSELDSLVGLMGFSQDYEIIDKMVNSISVEPEVVENVSNGDVIGFNFNIDEEAQNECNAAFMYNGEVITNGASAGEYTVEGLEEAIVINPFDCLDVSFEGISPRGVLKVDYQDPFYINDFTTYFNISNQTNLYNGQTITMKLDDDKIEYFAKEGYAFTQTSQEYIVEGLKEYLIDPGLMFADEDFYNNYIANPTDIFAKKMQPYENHSDYTYMGCVYADNSFADERIINELNVFYQVNIGDKSRIVVSRLQNLYICPPEEKINFDVCEVLTDDFAGVLGSLLSHHFGYENMEDALHAVDEDWSLKQRQYSGTYWYIDGTEQWSAYKDDPTVICMTR